MWSHVILADGYVAWAVSRFACLYGTRFGVLTVTGGRRGRQTAALPPPPARQPWPDRPSHSPLSRPI